MCRKLILTLVCVLLVFFTMSNAFGADSVQILYKCNQTNSTSDTISPWFEVVNNGTTTISLQRVKIRYWYTKDSTSSQVFECDWAQVGTANVSGSIIQMANPTSTADNYLEISFSSGAGNLAPLANSGEIQDRIHRSNWTNYNQSNDFSFNPSMTSFGQNLNVTGYIDGTLVFGVEPSTDTQAPSPPVNLSYNITSSTSIYLSWQASTDNVAVTGYKIYRDDIEVGDTNSPTTYYRDTGLTPADSYTYTVKAYDAVHNLSAASNVLGAPTDGTITNGFLVIVASPLYDTGNVSSRVTEYMNDISAQWTPKLIRINNVQTTAPTDWICPTPADLKEIIKDFGTHGYKGLVLIGSPPSIPTPVWKQLGVTGDAGAADLYYADINTVWNDVDQDGKFDSQQPVDGLPLNPNFGTVSGGLPSNWTTTTTGSATFSADGTQHYSGNYSAKIVANAEGDSSFVQTINVVPHSTYYLRGYVKTQDVVTSIGDAGKGAWLTISNDYVSANNVQGTTDWTEVVVPFDTNENTTVTLKCRLGGPDNTCTGTAWFDDLHLTKEMGATFHPEMIFGRITAGPISTSLADEAAKVEAYLSRVHAFRAPGYDDPIESIGFSFCESEWYGQGESVTRSMSTTLGVLRDIYEPSISSPDKLISELEMGSQYGVITTHAGPPSGYMDTWVDGYPVGGPFDIAKLSSISPKVRHLTLNGCHGSLYTVPNLGATYLFNNNYTLNVVGETLTTVGVWPSKEYYQVMSASCVGDAFVDQIEQLQSVGDFWMPVAMVLLGDPTIQYHNPTRNASPVVTTNPRLMLETKPNQELVIPLNITDLDDTTGFTAQVTGLPGATVDSGYAIHWTPNSSQVGQTLTATIQVSDSSGGTFVTDIPVYVSYFRNGLLSANPVDNGWTVSVPDHIITDDYWFPVYGLFTDGDHPVNSMSQTISNLQLNTDYTLAFKARTDRLSPAVGTASVRIGNTIAEVPLNLTPGYIYYSVRFNSGNNTSLPISVNAGNASNPCEGGLFISSLRLFPTPSYNMGFEQLDGARPARWYPIHLETNGATLSVDSQEIHGGSHSVKIVLPNLNCAYWNQAPIAVKPNTNYRLSGYTKTVGVTGGVGANLLVENIAMSNEITGTSNGWQPVQIEFNTGDNTTIAIQCRLGDGYSFTQGTAWFDDLTLVEIP